MEEDGRREAAIAKTPILQPNFKPVGISQTQLNKFQELRRRRLQIKSKFKDKSKPKGNKKIQGKDLKPDDCAGASAGFATEGSSVAKSDDTKEPSLEDNTPLVFKKRKLHWGLDAKERWERKSNM